MFENNNIRPVSLIYIPIIYGEMNEDGTVVEKKKTIQPVKEDKKTKNNLDFVNGFFSQTTLFDCVEIQLKIVLNVPIDEKEQHEVGFII